MQHIVSFGSSFAAGPGLKPISNVDANRSEVNYAGLLAKSLGAKHTDLSVSGATLSNVLTESQTSGKTTFPPQITQLPPDTDVITITAGGNDIGYIGGLMRDAISGTAYVGWVLDFVFDRLSGPRRSFSQNECNGVVERFVKFIDQAHTAAPKARIFLVTYLTCFGDDTQPGINTQLSSDQVEAGRRVAEALRECYVEAWRRRKDVCELLDVTGVSVSHGIGAQEEWVRGFAFGELLERKVPFHPTHEGMQYIAERLQEELSTPRAV